MSLDYLVLAGVVALVGLVAAAEGLAQWLRARRRVGGAPRATAEAVRQPLDRRDVARYRTTVELRLVAAGVEANAIVLDGVVVADAPLGLRGWPVSVRMLQPDSYELAVSLRDLFARWAAEDTIVQISAEGVEPRRMVSITDGLSIVRLTLGLDRREHRAA